MEEGPVSAVLGPAAAGGPASGILAGAGSPAGAEAEPMAPKGGGLWSQWQGTSPGSTDFLIWD